jgi:uncharacterized membrane protein
MAAQGPIRAYLPLLALIAVPLLSHVAIVETRHIHMGLVPRFLPLFKLSFVTVSALSHWAIYSALFLTFALTLRKNHDPLICAMARRLHGPLTHELARYTRRVTIAWSGFFLAQLVTSILLFAFAPLVVWSFFVNILDIPLVAAMFAAEYAVRLRVLRDPPRHSLASIISMIAEARKPREEPAGTL